MTNRTDFTDLVFDDVALRPAFPSELVDIYQLITDDEEWTKTNGPYFGYERPNLRDFQMGHFTRLCLGEECMLITINDKPIGSVSYYWENKDTRWLEVGVIIYDSHYWGRGIAFKALIPWISHLFNTLTIARVGLTTWSGNPRMMACATKLGLTLEGRMRKVRYYQGEYYDSIKYGVLQEEWLDLCSQFGSTPTLAKVEKSLSAHS